MKTSDDVFTTLPRWRDKRKKILRRDGFKDMYLYNKYGLIKEANIVHHILPREMFPQYTWEDWNLISVSQHTHTKILHNAFSGKLTKAGETLMRETAYRNGVKLRVVTLVIGNPGSGKTTWVQKNIGGGLAYDLDYIAAAFRVTRPKAEEHQAARNMANRLLKGFLVEAPKNTNEVFIIRTAPYEKELYEIAPDRLVVCKGGIDIGNNEKIKEAINYAEQNNIDIIYVDKSEKTQNLQNE